MKNLRGNHTSLTPLSEDISKILQKHDKGIRISPGLITQKNISVKQVSIKLKDESTSIAAEVLMKGSKQYLRIYGATLSELKNILKGYCKSKQILLK